MADGKDDIYLVPTIIINLLTIIINFYLLFIFFKSKSFHEIPLYNIIIFSFILFLDNIFRLIDVTDNKVESHNNIEKIQAFILAFFDKLILACLTMHTTIFYLGLVKSEFYSPHELKIHIFCFIINFIISLIIVSIYIGMNGVHQPSGRYYCYVDESKTKKILDTVFDSVYYLINLFCSINLFKNVSEKKKEAENKNNNNYIYFKRALNKIIFTFIITFITFLESFLIIYGVLDGPKTDLIYLITCLIIDFYIITNKTIINETLKIFCKNTYLKLNINLQEKTYEDSDNEEGRDSEKIIEFENRKTDF